MPVLLPGVRVSDDPLMRSERDDGFVVELWLRLFGQYRTVVYHRDRYPMVDVVT